MERTMGNKGTVRNITLQELRTVEYIEKLVQEAVKHKWVKTEAQIIECVRKS